MASRTASAAPPSRAAPAASARAMGGGGEGAWARRAVAGVGNPPRLAARGADLPVQLDAGLVVEDGGREVALVERHGGQPRERAGLTPGVPGGAMDGEAFLDE